jgi:hypothetical protein
VGVHVGRHAGNGEVDKVRVLSDFGGPTLKAMEDDYEFIAVFAKIEKTAPSRSSGGSPRN